MQGGGFTISPDRGRIVYDAPVTDGVDLLPASSQPHRGFLQVGSHVASAHFRRVCKMRKLAGLLADQIEQEEIGRAAHKKSALCC